MGFIKKAIGVAALKTTAKIVDNKLKKDYSREALMKKAPFEKTLTLDGYYSKHGGAFTVFDKKDDAKYKVKSSCWFHERSVTIYNIQGDKLAEIDLHMGIHPSCSLKLNEKDIGYIEMRKLTPPQKFEISLKGWGGSWRIQGDLPGWQYDVFDGDNVVYSITRGHTSGEYNNSYGLNYSSVSNELMGLLFLVAISLFGSIGNEHTATEAYFR